MDSENYGNYDIGSYITSKFGCAMEIWKASGDKSQYSPCQKTDFSSPGMLLILPLIENHKYVDIGKIQSLAVFLQASGNFVPLTFMTTFSTTLGYTSAFAAVLLAVNNGVNTISRILLGALADYIGRQNMIVLGMMGSAASVWGLWLTAATGGGKEPWIAFVVGYGILAGGMNLALFRFALVH